MWFVFQGLIIFGVFCWIGQHVDYVADPEAKRAAGGIGFLVALGATIVVACDRSVSRSDLASKAAPLKLLFRSL